MINIEVNFHETDFCDCCGLTIDPSNLRTLTFTNDHNNKLQNSVNLCKPCRKLLLNKLKEDLNEI